jgi:hypothetical protein
VQAKLITENIENSNLHLLQFLPQWNDDLLDAPLKSVRHDVGRLLISQLNVRNQQILEDQSNGVKVRAGSGGKGHHPVRGV